MKKIKLTMSKLWLIAAIILIFGSVYACKNDGNVNDLAKPNESEYLPTKKEGIVKILAIGNSFSEDAIENNLYQLAKEAGKEVIIGNLYIGGASLELHLSNALASASSYSYRKVTSDGVHKTYPKMSIETAVKDEYWDYISFQQASDFSGIPETVTASLPALYEYVNALKLNPAAKYIYHQTWAYAKNSSHAAFVNYGKDQEKMYKAIVETAEKAKNVAAIDLIIPAGTAIQNGRTSVVEDSFTRDGYHLDQTLGRYTAACAWFEAIFNLPVVGMKYRPDGLNDFETAIAQNAAHFAVKTPNKVTVLTEFQGGNSGALINPVNIDFGNNEASKGWNQINSFLAGNSYNLKDSKGSFVGVKLDVISRFNGINADGPGKTETDLNMPEKVSKYAYFGNSKAEFGGMKIEESVFVIYGLDKSRNYNLCFFGARGGVADNRETKYTCEGSNTVIVALNTSSNTNKTACANAIKPNAKGEIIVKVSAGDNNNNGVGFYYLTAARLTSN